MCDAAKQPKEPPDLEALYRLRTQELFALHRRLGGERDQGARDDLRSQIQDKERDMQNIAFMQDRDLRAPKEPELTGYLDGSDALCMRCAILEAFASGISEPLGEPLTKDSETGGECICVECGAPVLTTSNPDGARPLSESQGGDS